MCFQGLAAPSLDTQKSASVDICVFLTVLVIGLHSRVASAHWYIFARPPARPPTSSRSVVWTLDVSEVTFLVQKCETILITENVHIDATILLNILQKRPVTTTSCANNRPLTPSANGQLFPHCYQLNPNIAFKSLQQFTHCDKLTLWTTTLFL